MQDDLDRINGLVGSDNRVSYVIYGKEVGQNGTPHLQGFISFSRKLRMNQVKQIVGNGRNPHVSVARDVIRSIQYCKKDGDFYEFGEMPVGKGYRKDIHSLIEAVEGGMLDMKALRKNHPETCARFPRFVIEVVNDNAPPVVLPVHALSPWQIHLENLLAEIPDRRKIIFVVDLKGNSGKSWYAHSYSRLHPEDSMVILPGNKNDVTYSLKPNLRVIFFDAPRSKQGEYIQYDLLEELKNGYVFSPKYESRYKTYAPLHLVVNMNEQPNLTLLSEDRYVILDVQQLGHLAPQPENIDIVQQQEIINV